MVQKHYATAARLYAEALAATPQLTEDLRAGHRFNAARAAALAGGGHGDDAAGLGEPERAGLRKQARDWLRLDLAAWAKKVDTGTAADRIQAQKTLAPWRDDPDLAGLRDADTLREIAFGRTAGLPGAVARGCSPAPPCPNDPVSIRSACSTRSIARQLVAGLGGLGVFGAALGALLEAEVVELFSFLLQRGPLHPQERRGPVRAAQHAARFA